MTSKKKSGTTTHEREQFMRGHGYTKDRSCDGSHDIWIHQGMKALGKNAPAMPENLRSCQGQNAFEISVPDNPAMATWMRIKKQVEWCHGSVTQKSQTANTLAEAGALKREFKDTIRREKQWRHDVKHSLRQGQTPPPAPSSYAAKLTPVAR